MILLRNDIDLLSRNGAVDYVFDAILNSELQALYAVLRRELIEGMQ